MALQRGEKKNSQFPKMAYIALPSAVSTLTIQLKTIPQFSSYPTSLEISPAKLLEGKSPMTRLLEVRTKTYPMTR